MTMLVPSTAPTVKEYAPPYTPDESSGVETALMSFGLRKPSMAGNTRAFWRNAYLRGTATLVNLTGESAASLPIGGLASLDDMQAFSAIGSPMGRIMLTVESASHATAPNLTDAAVAKSENPILPKVRRIVEESAWETFADGMESALSRKLHSLIQTRGNEAVGAIRDFIAGVPDDLESAEEILRQVGYSEDAPTRRARLELLISSLYSSNPRIRDAASLGVAAMDDPTAIDALETAVACEPSALLRHSFTLALEQLRETKCQDS